MTSCSYVPINYHFGSFTYGKRPDGRKALLHIKQEGRSSETPPCLVSTEDVVEIIPTR